MANQPPTDALRLVPVEPTEAMIKAGRDAAQSAHAHHTPWTQEARSVFEAMLAAAPASPLPEGGGWQDIITAPKDEVILLYGLLDPHPTERHLHARLEEPKRFTGYWDDVDDAWCPVGSTWEGPWIEPTHWMPLPAAPTGDAK